MSINVKPSFRAVEFNSFHDAVDSVRVNDFDVINGKKLEDYFYFGNEIFLLFENSLCLFLFVGASSIEYKIVSREKIPKKIQIPDRIEFCFESGTRMVWEYNVVIDPLIGDRVAFSRNGQYVFLQTERHGDFMIDGLVDDAMHCHYLYLNEI